MRDLDQQNEDLLREVKELRQEVKELRRRLGVGNIEGRTHLLSDLHTPLNDDKPLDCETKPLSTAEARDIYVVRCSFVTR